jgi:hypothetical protein
MPRGLDLRTAIEVAQPNVAPGAELWGYAVGTYRDVLAMAPEAGRVVQPPDGINWDTFVWGIVFRATFDICPPPPPAGASPHPCESRPGLSTVYLDYQTGKWLTTAGYSPSADDPLPTPFYIVPMMSSPAPS